MTKNTLARYSPEVRARAVRMVLEHRGDYASKKWGRYPFLRDVLRRDGDKGLPRGSEKFVGNPGTLTGRMLRYRPWGRTKKGDDVCVAYALSVSFILPWREDGVVRRFADRSGQSAVRAGARGTNRKSPSSWVARGMVEYRGV